MLRRKSVKRLWALSAAIGSVVPTLYANQAKADSLQWDADSTSIGPQNGPGLWNAVSVNWLDQNGNQVLFTNGSTVVFGGALGANPPATGGSGGLVQLGANVTVSGIIFNDAGYTIGGGFGGNTAYPSLSGFTLNLAPAAVITANRDADISASLVGTSFTKTGAGMLSLDSASTLSSPTAVTIAAGKLAITNPFALGTANGTTTLDGGTLVLADNVQFGGPLTVTTNGGGIQVTAGRTAVYTGTGLTGTGTLLKTDLGTLDIVAPNGFAGNLVIGPSGGNVQLIASAASSSASTGSLTNPGATVTVNIASTFTVDNQNSVGGYTGFANNTNIVNINRLNDNINVVLNGGQLKYLGINSNATTLMRENFGTVTLNQQISTINAVPNGGVGAEMGIANLQRTLGATVNFQSNGGSNVGIGGNNGRIFLTAVNGSAPTTGLVGGWALVNATDYAYYAGGTVGVVSYAGTGAPGYASTLASGNVANLSANTTLASGTAATVGALRTGTTVTLTFANATQVFNVESGGILATGGALTIGATATPGVLTAGSTSTTGSGPLELFLHASQNITVNSQVADNPYSNRPVAVVIDGGQTIALNNATNTYSGGTFLYNSSLNTGTVAGASYLGQGPVMVNNGRLRLGNTENLNGNAITLNNQSALELQSATGQYTNEQIFVNAGSILWETGSGFSAGNGINSLTRATDPGSVSSGQVYLAPDSIIRANLTNDGNNGTGVQTVQNIGTNADLYFSPSTAGGTNQAITVGVGTSWKGLSTERSSATSWDRGTVFANSDFYLQGLLVNGGYQTLTVGGNNTTITNNTTGSINAYTIGNVTLNAINTPSNLTFVVTPSSTLLVNASNSLGSSAAASNNASVLVQAGGVVNFNGAVTNSVNANYTFQNGARFLADDSAAAGTLSGVGQMTFLKGSILDISQSNTLIGTATLNTQPGAIARLGTDSVVGISTRLGQDIYFELTGNRRLTSQLVGNGPETVTLNGGMITNDVASRTVVAGLGHVAIGSNGATIAASVNTVLTEQEDINFGSNTLNIGSTEAVGGNPKTGVVVLQGGGTAAPGAGINVLPGVQLQVLSNIEGFVQQTLPDNVSVNLGAGSSLLLQQGAFETVAGLSGSGSVQVGLVNNAAVTGALSVGYGNASSNYSGDFSTAGGSVPNLVKIGTGTFTLSGTSASTGNLVVDQGTVVYNGAGQSNLQAVINKGGSVLLDNTNASGGFLSNRLGGTSRNVLLTGGTLTLTGNESTAVAENIGQLRLDFASFSNFTNPTGGPSTLSITPGAGGSTIFRALTMSAASADVGQLILQGTGLGSAPGAGVSTFVVNTPGLIGAGGAAGSSGVSIRPDVLINTGSGLSFTTQDNTTNGFRALVASEYASDLIANNNSALQNLKLAGAASGFVQTTGINSLTVTAPGSSINYGGTNPVRLRIASGGILVNPGASAVVSAPYLDANGNNFNVYNDGDLTLNGMSVNTAGLVKSGTGTLNLGSGFLTYLSSRLSINDGVVNLAPGNVMYTGVTGSTPSYRDLYDNGGILNLNGNNLLVNSIQSNPLPGMGGVIQNNSGSNVTLATYANNASSFSGTVAGQVSLLKTGGGTLLLTDRNTYTGDTTIRAGTLQLRDSGTVTNTASLTSYYGTLLLDNTNSYSNINDRLATNITVALRGSSFILQGQEGGVSTQTVQSISFDAGQTIIDSRAGLQGTSVLTIGNLVSGTALGAMVDLRGNASALALGQMSTNALGTTNPKIFINSLNGSPISANIPFLGARYITNTGDFAAYSVANGVIPVSLTASGGPGYGSTMASGVIDNISATTTVPTGGTSVGAIRLAGAVNVQFAAANDLLNVESGGIIGDNGNSARSIGTNLTNAGRLTAGGTATSGIAELFFHVNQNTTTVNSSIVDNPNGAAVALVKTLGGGLTLVNKNTYTGGTIVEGGTLTLNLSGADNASNVPVPGDVTIYNATVTESTSKQFNSNATINFIGGGTLNMVNGGSATTTIKALNFDGEAGTETVNVGSNGTVVLGGLGVVINSVNNTAGSTPTIAGTGGFIDFGGAGVTKTIAVNGTSPIGLVISGNIQNAALAKTGQSMMILSGTNSINWLGGLDIQQGSVRVDSALGLGPTANVTTVRPGAMLIGNFNGTIAGSLNLAGGTLAPTTSTPNWAGNVAVTADSTVMLNQPDLLPTARNMTISGVLSGTNALTVSEFISDVSVGTLTLSNTNNTYSGTYTLVGNNGNSRLQSQSTGNIGSAIKGATFVLDGGQLIIRDDGGSGTGAANTTLQYNNDVTVVSNTVNPLVSSSFINIDRGSSTNSTGNTIALGSLKLGDATLVTSQGNNGYALSFTNTSSVTGPLGLATLNNGGTLNFPLALGATVPNPQLSKTGGGTLNLTAGLAPSFSNGTLNIGQATVNIAAAGGASNVNVNILPINNGTNAGGFAQITGTGYANVTVGGTFNQPNGRSMTANNLVINPGGGLGLGTATFTVNNALTNNGGVLVPQQLAGNATLGTQVASLRGTGTYYSGTNSSNTLTLAAKIVDVDGSTPTVLNASSTGSNLTNVNVTGNANTYTGGTYVQGGTLRVAPSVTGATPLGSGTVQVSQFGALQFDQGAGKSLSYTAGNLVNAGTVNAHSGTTTVSGFITGTTPTFVPGLIEGHFNTTNTSDTTPNPGNFGVKLSPRMGQINAVTQNPASGWGDNEMWVYSGQFFDADGKFAFAENIDDSVRVTIDGVTRLLNGTYNVSSTTANTAGNPNGGTANANPNGGTIDFGMGAKGDGWHTIEIRFMNGTGGAGPSGGNGFSTSYGFGYTANPVAGMLADGSLYTAPVDPGNGSLFRTQIGGSGTIAVDAGAVLAAGGFTNTAAVVMNTGATPAVLRVLAQTTRTDSAADAFTLTGTGSAQLDLLDNNVVTFGSLSTATNSTMTLTGNGKMVVTGPHAVNAGSTLAINGGTAYLNGVGSGTGNINVGNGGTLAGTGTHTAAVTLSSGGTLAPGNDNAGTVTINNNLTLATGANLAIDIKGKTAGSFDVVKVNGQASFGSSDSTGVDGANLAVTVGGGYTFNPGDTFVVLQNASTTLATTTVFKNLPDGATIDDLSGQVRFQVNYGDFDGGGVANDVQLTAIQAIPEPTALGLLGLGIAGLATRRRRGK